MTKIMIQVLNLTISLALLLGLAIYWIIKSVMGRLHKEPDDIINRTVNLMKE